MFLLPESTQCCAFTYRPTARGHYSDLRNKLRELAVAVGPKSGDVGDVNKYYLT